MFKCCVYTCTAPAFNESDTCTVQSTDAKSVTVSWPAPSSAQFYYIDIGSDTVKSFHSTSNVYRITGLSPITSYTFTVTVYGNADATGNSVECRGKTGLYLQGGPKKLAQHFLYALTLPNIKIFSKLFHF